MRQQDDRKGFLVTLIRNVRNIDYAFADLGVLIVLIVRLNIAM